MSDGREPRAPLYHLMRDRFQLKEDLDLCAVVYGPPLMSRSRLASLAPRWRRPLARVTAAPAVCLNGRRWIWQPSSTLLLPTPHSPRDADSLGGMFKLTDLIQTLFETAVNAGERRYEFLAPRLPLSRAPLCTRPRSLATL